MQLISTNAMIWGKCCVMVAKTIDDLSRLNYKMLKPIKKDCNGSSAVLFIIVSGLEFLV